VSLSSIGAGLSDAEKSRFSALSRFDWPEIIIYILFDGFGFPQGGIPHGGFYTLVNSGITEYWF